MSTRILVVDDDEMTLKLTLGVLKTDGFEVAAAGNGGEALSVIGQVRPALAILDVMMPDMDGYELCRQLRHRSDTANIPIIILTALSELDERLKAFEAGADDFIAKPFQPRELLARVKVLLRRAAPSEAESQEVQGEMTAVFSLRGGVGVSTLAANLAVGLSQVWPCGVTLVDLALANGQSALMLDVPLRNSWGGHCAYPRRRDRCGSGSPRPVEARVGGPDPCRAAPPLRGRVIAGSAGWTCSGHPATSVGLHRARPSARLHRFDAGRPRFC